MHYREVVLGRHSKVWIASASNARVRERFGVAIGHRELSGFQFTGNDRVWVFSYSRDPRENSALLDTIHRGGVREIVYVSSATTNVNLVTRCYQYPRVKQLAEEEVLRLPNARVLTLGLVFGDVSELPAGSNAATLQQQIDAFLLAPQWPLDGGTRMNLFKIVKRPFRSAIERRLHQAYGWLQQFAGRWPCLLRPLDFVLRACGMRWYGYVYLSNRLWTTTTS
jgi:hypothetical protein